MRALIWAALAVVFPILAVDAADAPLKKIVYSRQSGDRIVLHTINSDGTGDAELPGQTARLNIFATWSPDGKKLAYMTTTPPVDNGAAITVCNADGTGAYTLTVTQKISGMPAWSPDGKMLAFGAGDAHPMIFVSDLQGGGMRQVSPEGKIAAFPFWLPDGKRIGYTRLEPGEPKGEVYVCGLDGANESRLTQSGQFALAGANAVSPDGKRVLVIVGDFMMETAGVRVIDLESKVETTLFDVDAKYARGEFLNAPLPAWDADGKSVLLPMPGEKGRGLYRVSEDGKTRARVTPEGVDVFGGAIPPAR